MTSAKPPKHYLEVGGCKTVQGLLNIFDRAPAHASLPPAERGPVCCSRCRMLLLRDAREQSHHTPCVGCHYVMKLVSVSAMNKPAS
jgi:hypothetical protein